MDPKWMKEHHDDLNLPPWLSFESVRAAARTSCRLMCVCYPCKECSPSYTAFELARDMLIAAHDVTADTAHD
jgi:hypothetical protein